MLLSFVSFLLWISIDGIQMVQATPIHMPGLRPHRHLVKKGKIFIRRQAMNRRQAHKSKSFDIQNRAFEEPDDLLTSTALVTTIGTRTPNSSNVIVQTSVPNASSSIPSQTTPFTSSSSIPSANVVSTSTSSVSSTSTASTLQINNSFQKLFSTDNKLFPVTVVVTALTGFLLILAVIATLQWIAQRDCFADPEDEINQSSSAVDEKEKKTSSFLNLPHTLSFLPTAENSSPALTTLPSHQSKRTLGDSKGKGKSGDRTQGKKLKVNKRFEHLPPPPIPCQD